MKIKLLFASIIPLLITACSSGGHFNSRNNPIASLFEQSGSNSSELPQSSSSYGVSMGEFGPVYDHIDIDLTKMNATMVYSEVYNMMSEPSKFVGKVVKASGPFTVGSSSLPGVYYPAVVIKDATACCANGLEFVLYGVPPCSGFGGGGYPSISQEITVVGTFKTYLEGSRLYTHLVDAVWLKD